MKGGCEGSAGLEQHRAEQTMSRWGMPSVSIAQRAGNDAVGSRGRHGEGNVVAPGLQGGHGEGDAVAVAQRRQYAGVHTVVAVAQCGGNDSVALGQSGQCAG